MKRKLNSSRTEPSADFVMLMLAVAPPPPPPKLPCIYSQQGGGGGGGGVLLLTQFANRGSLAESMLIPTNGVNLRSFQRASSSFHLLRVSEYREEMEESPSVIMESN